MRKSVHLVGYFHVTVEILLFIKSQFKEMLKEYSPKSVQARTRLMQDFRTLSNAPERLRMV